MSSNISKLVFFFATVCVHGLKNSCLCIHYISHKEGSVVPSSYKVSQSLKSWGIQTTHKNKMDTNDEYDKRN